VKAPKITIVVSPEVLQLLPACPRCGVGPGATCVHARYGHGPVPIAVHPHPERTRSLRDRVEVLLGALALADRGDRSVLDQIPQLAGQALRRQIREARR
jgi:hypothetical protein